MFSFATCITAQGMCFVYMEDKTDFWAANDICKQRFNGTLACVLNWQLNKLMGDLGIAWIGGIVDPIT